ncbi:MAG: hypothetical protein ABIJ17_02795 [Patescibacteria group bacterium]
MKKKYLIVIAVLIFVISIAVRFWPILYKGYSFGFSFDNLILARNLNLTGEYSVDNEKNIILSSELINEQGIESNFGNKLTPVLYSKIFNIFSFNENIPLYVSLLLYGIISVLLFLLVFKLFNIQIALLFSFFEIFSPLVLQYSMRTGLYEWAMLFLTIALLIYLWKEKPNWIRLIFSSLFFALAFLARNSFLIIPIVFLIYDFWKSKSIKRIIIFILPLLIVYSIFFGLSGVNNSYLSSEDTTDVYLHIFSDSYTFHYERDDYVEKIVDSEDYNYDYSQFLEKYGYSISLKNKISMYWASITSYPKGFVAQTTFGGSILIFFLILGGFYLYKNKRKLLEFFILWAGFLYIFLIVAKSNHWGHFLSLQLPIFILISLGVHCIFEWILKQNWKKFFKYLFIIGFMLSIFVHLIQSDKWMLHEEYLYSKIDQSMKMVSIIKESDLNKKIDIVAVGGENGQTAMIINYYTDISTIYFHPQTIEKLLKENKLQWAFDEFGVTKIIGYNKELNDQMIDLIDIDILK